MTFPDHTLSHEAEENLLSLCLLDGPSIVSRCISAGIGPHSFTGIGHDDVFDCLYDLIRRDVAIDVGTLAEELKARGQLDAVGGYAFVTRVSSKMPTTANADYYITRVADLARQRNLITATAAAALAAASEAATGWAEVWDRTEPHLKDAQNTTGRSRRQTNEEIATEAAHELLHPENVKCAPTPWPNWDREATPAQAGELIVIGGRPGTGKTTLAGNLAADLAANGKAVAFFSLEMTAGSLFVRFARRRAGRDGIGHDRTANEIVAAELGPIGKQRGLHVFESSDAGSVSQIEAACRLLAAAPDGLDAVFIDYLQLVTPPADTKRDGREQQVAAMSRRFKSLATAVDCPVFLLAQLNRESEKEDRRPFLSDLRESGSIEQDADRVWFLYRPRPSAGAPQVAEDAAEIDVVLYQAKCRNGPAGIDAVLRFNRPTFDFRA